MDEVQVRMADEALVTIDKQHPPLEVTLCQAARTESDPKQPLAPSSTTLPSWNFSKANYHALYASFAKIDWSNFYRIKEPEEALDYFYATVNGIINAYVPNKRVVQVNSRYSYPKWYTSDIIRGIKRKAELHKLHKTSGSKEHYQAFSVWRARIKEMIRTAHENHLEQVQSRLLEDPKSFWSYVSTRRCTLSRHKISKDGHSLTDSECAEEFAKFFHSVYGINSAALNVHEAEAASFPSSARVQVSWLSKSEIRAALTGLKPKQSAGPDGIPVFVVRDCREVLAGPLGHIFNLCLDKSYFPERWKVTRVIPTPKGNTGTEVSGFRPIAILSTPAKVFESAVQRSMQQQTSAFLSDAQHGFRPARSTTSNLLNLMATVIPNVDAGVQVDVAYFDFKKAFDMVDNDILLTKLATIGCTTKLLQFFASYMKDRRQYVDYAGCKSKTYLTKTGVSQGSNLGPLEFIIMINDLPAVVTGAQCLLFADDLKLILPITEERDCVRLQKNVDNVVEWGKRNNLQFNVDKCSIITFSRATAPLLYNYKIKETQLKRVESVRDLGVHMDTELRFRIHVGKVCKKAYRILGFILRQANNFTNHKALTAMYNALVRSQLESAVSVWAPHEIKYRLMMERIQNKFARYLYWKRFGVYPFYPLMYPTLFVLGMVGYNKLEIRRDVARAVYLIKVFRGTMTDPTTLEMMKLCTPDGYVTRRRRPPLLDVPYGRTNLLNKAPLTRTLKALNQAAENIDLFHCSLSEFVRTITYNLCYVNLCV